MVAARGAAGGRVGVVLEALFLGGMPTRLHDNTDSGKWNFQGTRARSEISTWKLDARIQCAGKEPTPDFQAAGMADRRI